MSDSAGIDPRTQPNQNLARGLLILEAFTVDHPEWGVRDLARLLKANPTTMHRLLTTLENLGYVEQNSGTQRYRLGAKIMRLAGIYADQNPLPFVARRVFEEFSTRFEHSFYLGVLSNFEVVYTAVLDGRGALKISTIPGGRVALYTTAIGKILLAGQTDAFIESYLEAVTLERYTSTTITYRKALLREIAEVRKSGFAVNHGENFEEIGAVAVPLRDARGTVIAGLSLGYPMHWLSAGRINIEALRDLAIETADAIAYRLGGQLP